MNEGIHIPKEASTPVRLLVSFIYFCCTLVGLVFLCAGLMIMVSRQDSPYFLVWIFVGLLLTLINAAFFIMPFLIGARLGERQYTPKIFVPVFFSILLVWGANFVIVRLANLLFPR